MANKEKRIIITLDKNFGEIVFKKLRKSCGIMLLRLRNEREYNVIKILNSVFKSKHNLRGNFILISEYQIRIRKIENI